MIADRSWRAHCTNIDRTRYCCNWWMWVDLFVVAMQNLAKRKRTGISVHWHAILTDFSSAVCVLMVTDVNFFALYHFCCDCLNIPWRIFDLQQIQGRFQAAVHWILHHKSPWMVFQSSLVSRHSLLAICHSPPTTAVLGHWLNATISKATVVSISRTDKQRINKRTLPVYMHRNLRFHCARALIVVGRCWCVCLTGNHAEST